MAEAQTRPRITLTRHLAARRDLVFKMWSEPEHFAAWYGPRGFTVPVCEIELRPGGILRLEMRAPNGATYPTIGSFIDVVRPERIVFATEVRGFADRTTVTFADENGGTRLTLVSEFTKHGPDVTMALANMEKGWTETLERLGSHLETIRSSLERSIAMNDTAAKPTVRLDRVFDAPRELVYRAWTNPKHIARWWGPNQFTVPNATLDVRPGGKIRIDMQAPDGTVFPMTGVYREVVPNEKLVFTSYAFLGSPDGEPGLEAISTATFIAEGKKTRVIWEQTITAYKPEFVEAIAGMEEGMKQTFDRLGTHLASGETV